MTRAAKRSPMADVARVAGVPGTTVSFALDDTPGQPIPEETRARGSAVASAPRRSEQHPAPSSPACFVVPRSSV